MKPRVLLVVLGSLTFAACSGGGSTVPASVVTSDLPAASASNPLKASVSSLGLTSASATSSFVVSEKNYKGVFAASGCSTDIALNPKTGNGPSQRFKVTVVKAGKCTLKVADTQRHSVSIAVTVTTTTGVIR